MNKEQFRKELEDVFWIGWNICERYHNGDSTGYENKIPANWIQMDYEERIQWYRDQTITTRMAALDDGDGMDGVQELFKYGREFFDWVESILPPMTKDEEILIDEIIKFKKIFDSVSSKTEHTQPKPLDDGQEGKGLPKFLVVKDSDDHYFIWPKNRYEKYVSEAVEVGATPAVKIVVGFNGDEDFLFPKPLPVGESPAPEKLEHPNDLIKSLNWCKNLLSSITAAAIAGKNLDFVKHGTPFFEEMLNAYQSAKAVLAKPLPYAVTGGMKEALEEIYKLKPSANHGWDIVRIREIALKALLKEKYTFPSEGQPAQE